MAPFVSVAAVLLAASPAAAAAETGAPFVMVLGVAQDGGVPQAGHRVGADWRPERRRRVAALGLVEPRTGRRWLFDARRTIRGADMRVARRGERVPL